MAICPLIQEKTQMAYSTVTMIHLRKQYGQVTITYYSM